LFEKPTKQHPPYMGGTFLCPPALDFEKKQWKIDFNIPFFIHRVAKNHKLNSPRQAGTRPEKCPQLGQISESPGLSTFPQPPTTTTIYITYKHITFKTRDKEIQETIRSWMKVFLYKRKTLKVFETFRVCYSFWSTKELRSLDLTHFPSQAGVRPQFVL
jgi:hypothetical protein